MANFLGYAGLSAKYRVEQESQKRLLGKPFVKYGQCLAMFGYFFQLGGILGARYRDRLDEFGFAFTGLQGEPGSVNRYYADVAESIIAQVTECPSILDYIAKSECKKMNCNADLSELFLHHGMKKVRLESTIADCWYNAMYGAAFGAICPDDFRQLFERTHRKRDDESWRFARAAGLDIPERQDVMSYDEIEQEESEAFLNYCQQVTPAVYDSISST